MISMTTKTLLFGGHILLFASFVATMPAHRSAAEAVLTAADVPTNHVTPGEIPDSFDAPFGSYPNLLRITHDERESFSPVVIFPERIPIAGASNRKQNRIVVKDHRRSSGELASMEDIEQTRTQKKKKNNKKKTSRLCGEQIRKLLAQCWTGWFGFKREDHQQLASWAIGKYDENRDGGMYESDLFDDLDNTIDGYGGRRTVHLGMDLGGPVGTPVHAFCDGVVHSVGYNPDLGDYGHVIVVEHVWGGDNAENTTGTSSSNENEAKNTNTNNKKRCWALYGHLDESTLTTKTTTSRTDDDSIHWNKQWRRLLPNQKRKQKSSATSIVLPGDFVEKGQVLGHMGDIDENGGWIKPHLHFQLSTKPPTQPHDMPGASSVQDRIEALKQYPDPRYVLGPMY